ncbi:MAG: prepilin-type N-terminal cleavage/methylation domain-containing protein [Desulfobacterales bacterium]|jgi:prepilin-type N-terminal cleavage/methylation domain-containing protein|nr:prepilin-type N-terminal cleavage/methylation domain-containing protein [Desulfobacterales bacterium]
MAQIQPSTDCGSNGLTLVEILVAMLILSILTGGLYSFFASEQRAYERAYLVQERDQNLRFAMNTLKRELTEAGCYAAGDTLVQHLSDWIPDAFIVNSPLRVRMDHNPKITLGEENEPDMISFLSTVPTNSNPTTLFLPASGTRLTTVLSESKLKEQFMPGDIFRLGEEPVYARVTGIVKKELEIDTDPALLGNQPCEKYFPAGTVIGEISMVTYTVFNAVNDPQFRRHTKGRPVLKRRVNSGGFQPVAENILDMQLGVEADGCIRVSLTGQTDATSLPGTAMAEGGVITRTCRVRLRNLSQIGIGSECPLPALPENVNVAAALDENNPCRISLTWDPVSLDAEGESLDENTCCVTGYRVFFDVAPQAFGYSMDVAADSELNVTLDVRAIPADVYYVSVAAVNDGGLGEKTAEIRVRDLFAPPAPSGLSAVLNADESVSLAWEAPLSCDLAGFHVVRKIGVLGDDLRISNGLIPSHTLLFTDTSPPAGETSRYTVLAEDHGFNVSAPSEAATLFIPDAPPPESP